jgi:hypothetical protein
MKIELVKKNLGGKKTFQILLEGNPINSYDAKKLIPQLTKVGGYGFMSKGSCLFIVNDEEKFFTVSEPPNYYSTPEEFKNWVESINNVKNWAESVSKNNETIIYTEYIK